MITTYTGVKKYPTTPRLSPCYLFVHQILKDFAFQSPQRCLEQLSSMHSKTNLDKLWQKAAKQDNNFQTLKYWPKRISFHWFRVHQNPCLILQLPVSVGLPETYFVALVFKMKHDKKCHHIEFLTLESGILNSEMHKVCFCQWTKKGRHEILDTFEGKASLNLFLKNVLEKTGKGK